MEAAIKEAEDETKQEAVLQRLPETVRFSGTLRSPELGVTRTSSIPDDAKWHNAKAGRVPRPMPKQATLGDFISANSFAALQVPELP